MPHFTGFVRRYHPIILALAIIATTVATSGSQSSATRVDELTVRRIHVLDADGRERLTIGGDFAPRRAEMAGILFHNEQGHEAGGLVYWGQRSAQGEVQAGGLLTFDQYGEDQIMVLKYEQTGARKTNGLTFIDRPNEMGEHMLALYKAVEGAASDEERERIKKEMLPKIPPEERPARRLFVGRSIEGASLITLSDKAGQPRLELEVDESGNARIAFLDASGKAVRTITP
jgi:hypothetical protein